MNYFPDDLLSERRPSLSILKGPSRKRAIANTFNGPVLYLAAEPCLLTTIMFRLVYVGQFGNSTVHYYTMRNKKSFGRCDKTKLYKFKEKEDATKQ